MTKTTTITTKQKGVHLVGLYVRNYNRIELVELAFRKEGLVPVAGRNGNGKSSLLDSIAWAFGGPRAIPGTVSPIRHGAKKAEVIVRTDAFELERVQTPSGTRFVVRSPEGAEIKTSQAALDAMYSTLTFDPEAFARMRPAEQRAALVRAIGLESDLDRIAAKRQALYEERTVANRKVRDLEVQFKALEPPDMFAGSEEVSAGELIGRIRLANEQIADRRTATDRTERHRAHADNLKATIERLESELQDARQQFREVSAMVSHDEEILAALPEPEDLDLLERKLSGIEASNQAVRAARTYRERKAEVEAARDAAEGYDRAIAEADGEREALLAGARLPVDGLRIEDEGLSLHGVPLGQASSSERIRIGVALAIAQNPELKVLRIAAGSLLDAEARAEVDRLAKRHGFLVLAEMVEDEPTGAAGEIWIEEGRAPAAATP